MAIDFEGLFRAIDYTWLKPTPKYRYTLHTGHRGLYVVSDGYSGNINPGDLIGYVAANSPYEAASQHLEQHSPVCIREVKPLDYDGTQGVWLIDYCRKEQ